MKPNGGWGMRQAHGSLEAEDNGGGASTTILHVNEIQLMAGRASILLVLFAGVT